MPNFTKQIPKPINNGGTHTNKSRARDLIAQTLHKAYKACHEQRAFLTSTARANQIVMKVNTKPFTPTWQRKPVRLRHQLGRPNEFEMDLRRRRVF